MRKNILTIEEINDIAQKFIDLKEKASASDSKQIKSQYKSYQNYCIEKFKHLIINKVRRYRKFSNYADLEQDGYEALICALETYKPEKGNFCWWAEKYIKTKIYRSANNHSIIRIPIKKAKDNKPYKVTGIPIMIDSKCSALEGIENDQVSEAVMLAVQRLDEQHKTVVNMFFGFNGSEKQSVKDILKTLNISRTQFLKLLDEAKIRLKNILQQSI